MLKFWEQSKDVERLKQFMNLALGKYLDIPKNLCRLDIISYKQLYL